MESRGGPAPRLASQSSTAVSSDVCDGCGFDFDAIAVQEIAPRSIAGATEVAAELVENGEQATKRPSPDRWSNVEYAAHIRDVMLTIRDRIVLRLVEDNPGFKPLYRDERIDRGLYRLDTPEVVAVEVAAAVAMFVRLFEAIDEGSLGRMVQYGHPSPVPRMLAWMSKQVVHETEHHLADMRENARALGP